MPGAPPMSITFNTYTPSPPLLIETSRRRFGIFHEPEDWSKETVLAIQIAYGLDDIDVLALYNLKNNSSYHSPVGS